MGTHVQCLGGKMRREEGAQRTGEKNDAVMGQPAYQ